MIESHFRNLQYQGSSPFQKGVLMEEMGHLGCIGSLFAGDNSGPDHPKKKQKKKNNFVVRRLAVGPTSQLEACPGFEPGIF
jgi:hypothetical protein